MRVEKIEDRWSQEQLMTGVDLPTWLRILKKNKFQVDATYLHRAAWITGMSLPSTLFGAIDDAVYGRRLQEMDIDPTPIIVLGHWRTGTTHLHNLLGRDPGNTYTSLYQCVFPGSFLTTGKAGPWLLRDSLPETRNYDNVAQGWGEPAEDEIALMKLTSGLAFYTALLFPDQSAKYERYIDFLEATPDERRIWKKSLELFIKKVMFASGGKRVVLKSCAHSARIRMLLEMFPDAKFIHIHRHPARTFRSTVHLRSKVDWENFMHRPKKAFIEQRWEHTASIGERLYTRLIEDKGLIPEGNLVEIAYSDLVGNEMNVMRDIYEKLQLPEWERTERVLGPYLESIAGYQVNKLDIEPELEEFVYDRWRLVYDTYGYSKEYKA